MTQASAVKEAQRLKTIMATHGVTATVELKAGRSWSGDIWYSQKKAVINHHTAGSINGMTPSYAICRNGRSDLPGPLCNGYGGRDHVYRIVTMGLANHPGLGGPLTLAGFTIPKDSARISTWGTEWEHDGTTAWPADMVNFMARANAALDEFLAIPVERQIEHSTWAPKRKIDRNAYTAERGQQEIRAVMDTVPPPAPTTFAPGSRTLGRTEPPMTGADVAYLQKKFVAMGNSGLKITRRYDQPTADIAAVFKEHRGIIEPGFGPKSWAQLG